MIKSLRLAKEEMDDLDIANSSNQIFETRDNAKQFCIASLKNAISRLEEQINDYEKSIKNCKVSLRKKNTLLKRYDKSEDNTLQKGFEKRFSPGDIVYWCHHTGNANYSVHYGMVDKQFSDVVVIDYIVPRERRRVDGVPIDEFQSEQRYRKLPKGWTYNTQLFELTWDDLSEEEKVFCLDITKPDSLKIAYDKGFLVKDKTIFHGSVEDEITKEGFRIVKKYSTCKHHIDHVSIFPYKVYFTYEEAKKEVNDNITEFYRQAALSDYDWSVEQIDKTLDQWRAITDSSEMEQQEYRDWLLSLKNIEDIETRVFGGNIQWKYWKNKNWNYIEL